MDGEGQVSEVICGRAWNGNQRTSDVAFAASTELAGRNDKRQIQTEGRNMLLCMKHMHGI